MEYKPGSFSREPMGRFWPQVGKNLVRRRGSYNSGRSSPAHRHRAVGVSTNDARNRRILRNFLVDFLAPAIGRIEPTNTDVEWGMMHSYQDGAVSGRKLVLQPAQPLGAYTPAHLPGLDSVHGKNTQVISIPCILNKTGKQRETRAKPERVNQMIAVIVIAY